MNKDAAPVDLNDELWTWQHVARYVHRVRNAVFTLVNQPGFPAPIAIAGDRLWVSTEVRAFMLASRDQAPAPVRATRRSGGGRVLEAVAPGGDAARPRRGRPRHA